jgi:hypothetical protein
MVNSKRKSAALRSDGRTRMVNGVKTGYGGPSKYGLVPKTNKRLFTFNISSIGRTKGAQAGADGEPGSTSCPCGNTVPVNTIVNNPTN